MSADHSDGEPVIVPVILSTDPASSAIRGAIEAHSLRALAAAEQSIDIGAAVRAEAEPQALDLGAIEARANAASPGPWVEMYPGPMVFGRDGAALRPSTDCAFIANARQDVPRLVARVRELEALYADAARFRDAYKRAKAENDERFMRERDEARERVRELEAEHEHIREERQWWVDAVHAVAPERVLEVVSYVAQARAGASAEVLETWRQRGAGRVERERLGHELIVSNAVEAERERCVRACDRERSNWDDERAIDGCVWEIRNGKERASNG